MEKEVNLEKEVNCFHSKNLQITWNKMWQKAFTTNHAWIKIDWPTAEVNQYIHVIGCFSYGCDNRCNCDLTSDILVIIGRNSGHQIMCIAFSIESEDEGVECVGSFEKIIQLQPYRPGHHFVNEKVEKLKNLSLHDGRAVTINCHILRGEGFEHTILRNIGSSNWNLRERNDVTLLTLTGRVDNKKV